LMLPLLSYPYLHVDWPSNKMSITFPLTSYTY
jgi:hypothetical protein